MENNTEERKRTRSTQTDRKERCRMEATPYLSELDFRIMEGVCGGEDKATLAYSLGMKKKTLLIAYEDAMQRLRVLNTLTKQVQESGPIDRYTKMLRELGFLPFYRGVRELETAVQLVVARPELMDCMQDGLYTEVARTTGAPVATAQARIRLALKDRQVHYWRAEVRPDFYNAQGMLDRTVNVKRFLQTFLLYVESHDEEE